jgi:hypothetical protein
VQALGCRAFTQVNERFHRSSSGSMARKLKVMLLFVLDEYKAHSRRA